MVVNILVVGAGVGVVGLRVVPKMYAPPITIPSVKIFLMKLVKVWFEEDGGEEDVDELAKYFF